MTGRERFLRAIRNQALDRPPTDYWAEEPVDGRLVHELGYSDLDAFLDNMGVDIRTAKSIPPAEVHLGDEVYQDHAFERYTYRYFPYGKMREHIPGILSEAKCFDDIKKFRLPDIDDFDFSRFGAICKTIHDKGCAVRYGWGDVWQRPSVVRGMEQTYMDMYDNPEWTLHLSRVYTDFYKAEYSRAWEESGGRIDMFIVISDLGSMIGPLISLTMFRKFVKPFLKEMTDHIHKLGSHIVFHSCGDMSMFIPDVIEIGVDILDPTQPANHNMSPESLARYNGKICFHGGIDVQHLLPTGRPEEIQVEAKRYFNLLGPSYILSPAHFFQPNIPNENIVAVYKTFSGTQA